MTAWKAAPGADTLRGGAGADGFLLQAMGEAAWSTPGRHGPAARLLPRRGRPAAHQRRRWPMSRCRDLCRRRRHRPRPVVGRHHRPLPPCRSAPRCRPSRPARLAPTRCSGCRPWPAAGSRRAAGWCSTSTATAGWMRRTRSGASAPPASRWRSGRRISSAGTFLVRAPPRGAAQRHRGQRHAGRRQPDGGLPGQRRQRPHRWRRRGGQCAELCRAVRQHRAEADRLRHRHGGEVGRRHGSFTGIQAFTGTAGGDRLDAAAAGTGLFTTSLEGRAGNDTLIGGFGPGVQASYASSPAAARIDLTAGSAQDGWGGTDTLVAIRRVAVTSGFADTVLGSGGGRRLPLGRRGRQGLRRPGRHRRMALCRQRRRGHRPRRRHRPQARRHRPADRRSRPWRAAPATTASAVRRRTTGWPAPPATIRWMAARARTSSPTTPSRGGRTCRCTARWSTSPPAWRPIPGAAATRCGTSKAPGVRGWRTT